MTTINKRLAALEAISDKKQPFVIVRTCFSDRENEATGYSFNGGHVSRLPNETEEAAKARAVSLHMKQYPADNIVILRTAGQ